MGRKVLIVTYYWPPSGGGGVQRWLKFVKYLPENGWTPIVFTPENPDFELKDDSLLQDQPEGLEVIKLPIREPFAIYRKLLGKKAVQQQGVVDKSSKSLLSKLAIWVRGNLFIPDARVFWVKPAAKFLINYLKENPVDVIVTTGPPHSMHLIGSRVKRKLGIPWLADFRDPWSEWDVLKQLQLNKKSSEKHRQMEFEVLNLADKVVTVSNRLGARLDELSGIGLQGVEVITNGYDSADFDPAFKPMTDKFRIVHMGLLNDGRNPTKLWKALDELCKENEEFGSALEVVLAGTIENSVKESIAGLEFLSPKVEVLDYIPHKEALSIYRGAALLLLLVNQTSNSSWILPSKMYEYFSTKKSIMALGHLKSDANDILKECGYSEFLEYGDGRGIKERIIQEYYIFKEGRVILSPLAVKKYDRRNLTKELVLVLESLVLH